MNRSMDKHMKAVQDFLAEHATEDMSMEEINLLLQNNMEEINKSVSHPKTEKEAKTADDFMELAERAGNQQEALRLVRKAVKLDPEDLEAAMMELKLERPHPLQVLNRLGAIVDKGRRQLEKRAALRRSASESSGRFWKPGPICG